MTDTLPTTPSGYSNVPVGHVATVVTCLEMLEQPTQQAFALADGYTLTPFQLSESNLDSDLANYRALFRQIGEDWLWFSRLLMTDAQLTAILQQSSRQFYILRDNDQDVGLLELDFGIEGQAELAFFGLVPQMIGKGMGRVLMNMAIKLAWAKPIQRFWVHTCTLDHPSALAFYIRSGFTPYALQIEVQADPRLSGHLPLDAAPHVPIIATALTE